MGSCHSIYEVPKKTWFKTRSFFIEKLIPRTNNSKGIKISSFIHLHIYQTVVAIKYAACTVCNFTLKTQKRKLYEIAVSLVFL